MARPKGSPKLGGRQKGTQNKITREVRQTIQSLVEYGLEKAKDDLDGMNPLDRQKLVVSMLPYITPRLSNIDLNDVRRSSMDELEERLKKLSNSDE